MCIPGRGVTALRTPGGKLSLLVDMVPLAIHRDLARMCPAPSPAATPTVRWQGSEQGEPGEWPQLEGPSSGSQKDRAYRQQTRGVLGLPGEAGMIQRTLPYQGRDTNEPLLRLGCMSHSRSCAGYSSAAHGHGCWGAAGLGAWLPRTTVQPLGLLVSRDLPFP